MVGVAVLRMLLSRKMRRMERLSAVRASTSGTPVTWPVPSLVPSWVVFSAASLAISGGTDAAMEGTSESRTAWCGCVWLGLRELVLLGCFSGWSSVKDAPSCEDRGLVFS